MPLTISLAPSGALTLALPDNGRELVVPANERGLATIVRLLQEQAANPQGKLGTPSRPTQSIVDAWLAAGGRIEDEGARSRARIEERYGASGLALMDKIQLEI